MKIGGLGLRTLGVAAAFLVLMGTAAGQSTWYVDTDASPGGDGSSWSTAFTHVEDALAAAAPGDEVRVAEGVYTPPLPILPYTVKKGVAVRGSYAGQGHAAPDAQDVDSYPTVLSGDILGDDQPEFINRTENSDHVVVVVAAGTDAVTVLDSLVIRGGYADGEPWTDLADGGGVWTVDADLRLERCTLEDNYAADEGGGLYAADVDVELFRCTIENNRADDEGGGLFVHNGRLDAKAVTVAGNEALGSWGEARGGGLATGGWAGAVRFRDSLLRDNLAQGTSNASGGAVYANVPLAFIGCRISGNEALAYHGARGGAVSCPAARMTSLRSLFDGNLAECTEELDGAASGGAISSYETHLGQSGFFGNAARSADSHAMGGAASVGWLLAVDSVFSGNSVEGPGLQTAGGAVQLAALWPESEVVHCTFANNAAVGPSARIGGLAVINLTLPLPGDHFVRNSVFWGNTDNGSGGTERAQLGDLVGLSMVIDYCDVQGWTGAYGGTGNFAADPQFGDEDGPDDVVGTADDILRPGIWSPCLDAGHDGYAYPDLLDLDGDRITDEDIPLDLDRRLRFVDSWWIPNGPGGVVDIGAYEGPFYLTDQWGWPSSGLRPTRAWDSWLGGSREEPATDLADDTVTLGEGFASSDWD